MASNLTLISCSPFLPKIPAKTTTSELLDLRIHHYNDYHLSSPSSATSIFRRRPNLRGIATSTQSQRFVYPDPIPDFAIAETEKFKVELKKKLIEDEGTFGEELDIVVSICAKISSGKVRLQNLENSMLSSLPRVTFMRILVNTQTQNFLACIYYGMENVQIFAEFLHKEYGGPGTLMVEPFTYMFVALNEKKLPGASLAARSSLLWAQNHVDHDWEDWNGE